MVYNGTYLPTCIYCLYSFTMGLVSFIEASHASMGGVLSLVYHISYIVTYCVYLHSMSHPLTSMISDARQYTLTLCNNFCNSRTYLTLLPALFYPFSLHHKPVSQLLATINHMSIGNHDNFILSLCHAIVCATVDASQLLASYPSN